MHIPTPREQTLSWTATCCPGEGFAFSSPFVFREQVEHDTDVTLVDDEESEDEKERHPLLVCRLCGHGVAKEKDQISVAGTHRHTFFNPAGIVYELGCFREAAGCVLVGSRSPEFSWFAGCLWQVALCRGCGNHLGWHFLGDGQSFFGLILAELIPGGE